MLLHLSGHQNTVWFSGDNIIGKIENNVPVVKYYDSTKVTGQIRSFTFFNDSCIAAVSFSGKIIFSEDKGKCWGIRNSIPGVRFRSIIHCDNWLLAAGDTPDGKGVLYYADTTGWQWREWLSGILPAVHRMVIHEGKIWLAGKKGLLRPLSPLFAEKKQLNKARINVQVYN